MGKPIKLLVICLLRGYHALFLPLPGCSGMLSDLTFYHLNLFTFDTPPTYPALMKSTVSLLPLPDKQALMMCA